MTTPLERAAVACLQAQGADWFPDLDAGGTDVRLASRQERPRCSLLRYEVGPGRAVHEVLVKARCLSPRQAPGTRPRLALDVEEDLDQQAARELAGLTGIAVALDGSDPRRFGVVRPLALLHGHAALAMDFVQAPTLREVLLRAALRRTRVPDDVWRNAGGWLATFQRGAPAEDLPVRMGTRDEVAELFLRYAEHIGREEDEPQLTTRLAAAGERAAADLPAALRLAAVHHDFALRNVLLGDSGRVTVIDPMTTARAPAHEDAGRFLVGLRAIGVQLATRSRALPARHLDAYERAFLEGYAEGGGDTGPALRVLHALVLLDRWAAEVTRTGNGSRSWRTERLQRWASAELRIQALRLLSPYE